MTAKMSQSSIQPAQGHTVTQSYRSVVPLPGPIADRAAITIEEQLYTQALHLLTQCLTAGTSGPRAAGVPTQNILTLITTLSVHPFMTSRTTSAEKHNAAEQASQYLQLLNNLVGPQLSGLRTAFRFADARQARTGRIRSRVQTSDEDDEREMLHTAYARSESLWKHANDVWSIIGWAFNCSVIHKGRWAYWRPFLLLLVDMLERDLEITLQEESETSVVVGKKSSVPSMEGTLLYNYLSGAGSGRQTKRRIMKALLANGSQQSLAEFGEIWKDETAPPKVKSEQPRMKLELDLDNDQYGDYDDSSGDDRGTSQKQHDLEHPDTHVAITTSAGGLTDTEQLGDSTAIGLRQRFLSLLIHFCHIEPRAFLELEELLDLYADGFRDLAIRPYQQLLFPAAPFLQPDIKASLDQILLRPLLEASAPVYTKNALTQEDFEIHYAPFAAQSHSVADNAKVSLLIEDLMRMLWRADSLVYSDNFRTTIANGIDARNKKAKFDARKRDADKSLEERESRQELRLSAERMLCILVMIQ